MKPYALSFAAHFLFLLLLLFYQSAAPKKIHPKPIQERTFVAVCTPEPAKQAPPVVKPKPAVQKEAPKPEKKKETAKPTPKKEPPKPKKAPSKPKPKNDPPSNPQSDPKKEKRAAALKKLQEAQNIATHTHTPTKKASSKQTATITLESERTVKESAYDALLMAFLQDHLKLPEAGFVRIQLTLSSAGDFKGLKILECESKKNRLYVESALSPLHFPSFEGEKQKSFRLVLENI